MPARNLIAALVMVMGGLGAIVFEQAPAAADYVASGCRLAPAGDRYVTDVNFSADLDDRMQEAMDRWNAKQNDIYFMKAASGSPRIYTSQGTYAGTFYAVVIMSCPTDSEVDILYDTGDTSGLGLKARRWVLIHEIGHTAGLDDNHHSADSCGETIMKGNACVSAVGAYDNPPWFMDVNGVEALN